MAVGLADMNVRELDAVLNAWIEYVNTRLGVIDAEQRRLGEELRRISAQQSMTAERAGPTDD